MRKSPGKREAETQREGSGVKKPNNKHGGQATKNNTYLEIIFSQGSKIQQQNGISQIHQSKPGSVVRIRTKMGKKIQCLHADKTIPVFGYFFLKIPKKIKKNMYNFSKKILGSFDTVFKKVGETQKTA